MLECEQQYHQLQSGATRSLNYEHRFQTYHMPMTVFIGFGMAGNGAEEATRGWKIHIGIDDSSYENMERGWNTILPILQELGIGSGKVVKQNLSFATTNASQCGKQVTIYCFKQSTEVDWAQFCTRITDALRNASVRCAPLSPNEIKMPGTEYISYRNDISTGTIDDDPHYVASVHGANPFAHFNIAASGEEAQRPLFIGRTTASSSSSSSNPNQKNFDF